MFNVKNATVLTRAQQKNVKGGGDGPCCVHYRSNADNSYLGKTCGHSVSHAQHWFSNASEPSEGGSHVSGYCCASC